MPVRAASLLLLTLACAPQAADTPADDTPAAVDTTPVDTTPVDTDAAHAAAIDAILDPYVGTWQVSTVVDGCSHFTLMDFELVFLREGPASLRGNVDGGDEFTFTCDADVASGGLVCADHVWVIEEQGCAWDSRNVMTIDPVVNDTVTIRIEATKKVREPSEFCADCDGFQTSTGVRVTSR